MPARPYVWPPLTSRLASSGSNGCAQRGAELSVMLDVPLATYGSAAGFATFGIEQNPFPPSGRLGADSRIVLLEVSFQVSRPADIGSAIILASASQHVNGKKYLALWGRLAMDKFRFVPQRELAAGWGRSHSPSFDQRRRPETLRTAMATAFFWPTSTTSRLPRVTPV